MSERDIDLLRLLSWCQYIEPRTLSGVCSRGEWESLAGLGLIKLHERSGALVLTSKGTSFLNCVLGGATPQQTQSYHGDAIQRRLRLSRLALTAYHSGVHLFTTQTGELSRSPSLFLSALTRGRGTNPWGSTRVAALAHLGGTFFAMHYVCPEIGRLSLTDELTAFTNQTARFRGAQRAFFFAGDSYRSVLSELEALPSPEDARLIRYGDAYRLLTLPVHLLSCDAAGVAQLQIMAVPGYRKLLTRAALKNQYRPPPEDVPAWDALFQDLPFVLAVDMDLRRVDAAIQAAQSRGLGPIAIAALEGQAKEVLFPRYRDTGLGRVFILTEEALSALPGGPPRPYLPARTQFLTSKGDVVDAPPFKAGGAAGGRR